MFLIFFAVVVTTIESTNLNQNELQISIDLIHYFGIQNMIFVYDEVPIKNLNNIKIISSQNIAIKFLSEKEIFPYVVKDPFIHVKTIIIYKASNNFELFTTSRDIIKSRPLFSFMSKFTWLIFLSKTNNDLQLIAPYDCQFITVRPINESIYKLSEIYSLKEKRIFVDYGIWDSNEGLKVSETFLYLRRSNMNQTNFLTLKDSIMCDVRVKLKLLLPFRCHHFEVFKDVTKQLNFRYEQITIEEFLIKAKSDPQCLYDIDALQEAKGLVKEFLTKSFSKCLQPKKFYLYIKYPEEELTPDYYVRPFKLKVWISIFAAVVVGGASSVVIEYIDIYFFKRKRTFQFHNLVFIPYECLCNQGTEERENISFRISIISFYFLAFFIMPAFSADLIAYLSIRNIKIPFSTLEDFVQNGKYKIIIHEDANFLRLLFRTSDDPLIKHINTNFIKNETLIGSLCKEYLVLADSDVEKNKSSVPCRIFRIPRAIFQYFPTIYFGTPRYRSPYTWILDNNFLKLRQAGVFQRIDTVNTEPDLLEEGEDYISIAIKQTHQIFFYMAVGIFISWIVLLCELFVERFTKRKRMTKIIKINKKHSNRIKYFEIGKHF